MQVVPKSIAGLPTTMIHDVTVPTMMIFPPKGQNTGASMIVFPGGGFKVLAIDLEGTEVCDWVTKRGMTCILLKYRVPKSADYWDDDCNCRVVPKVARALQDAQRTIKIIRSRARDLGIDPHKIGVIGFSAGGFMVAQTSNIFEPAYKHVDAIDRESSRPDFAIAAYPGHLCRTDNTFNSTIHVTKQTPPTFIVQDWDDSNDDVCDSILYARALANAGVPAEVHLFAKGDHAFALRHVGHPVEMWPLLVEKWLKEISIL
jgi:acetyl esterase/lipase